MALDDFPLESSMKCNPGFSRFLGAVGMGILGLMLSTCEESLPVYKFPDRILSLQITKTEQLSDQIAVPGKQMVHFQVTGQNIFDDIFQDQVDVKGTMRIWWKRKPSRYRTLYLTEKNFSNRSLIQNGRLTLLSGQKFTLDAYWNIKTDDSLYLPNMDMIYQPTHPCASNVACGEPEIFVVECSLSVYDRLGFVQAPAFEFLFVKRECVHCGLPPCPTPAGGCQ